MSQNFNTYEDNFNMNDMTQELLSYFDFKGIIRTFEMLKYGIRLTRYWEKYQQDRINEEQNIETNSYNNSITSSFSPSTEKRSADEEKELEFASNHYTNLLKSACTDYEFIDLVKRELSELDYDSKDTESRSKMVATILSIENFIIHYPDKSEMDPEWQDIKEIIAQKIKNLCTEDYEILYHSVDNTYAFFDDSIFSDAHSSQISKMKEENFCALLYFVNSYTEFPIELHNIDGIKNSIIQKKEEFSAKYANYFYNNYYNYTSVDINNIQTLTDIEKIEIIQLLKFEIISKVINNSYSSFSEKEHTVENSKEFQTYLNLLTNLNNEQFALYMFDCLSNLELAELYGKEKEIIQNRLNKLSQIQLLAISKKLANGDREELQQALEQYKDKPIDEKTQKKAEMLYEIYNKISRNSKYQAYFKFEIPKSSNTTNDNLDFEDETTQNNNTPLVEAFRNCLKINQINTTIMQSLIFICDSNDKNFIRFATKYNKKYPYTANDSYNNLSSEDIQNIIVNAEKCIQNSLQRRIFSLSPKSKLLLYEAQKGTTGILTPAIILNWISGISELNNSKTSYEPINPNNNGFTH